MSRNFLDKILKYMENYYDEYHSRSLKVTKNISRSYFNKLSDYLTKISYRREMRDFLRIILTSHEREEISGRLMIIELLKKGHTQREISKKLKVSIGKVTRCSQALNNFGS